MSREGRKIEGEKQCVNKSQFTPVPRYKSLITLGIHMWATRTQGLCGDGKYQGQETYVMT